LILKEFFVAFPELVQLWYFGHNLSQLKEFENHFWPNARKCPPPLIVNGPLLHKTDVSYITLDY